MKNHEQAVIFTKAAVRNEEKPILHVQPLNKEKETRLTPEPSLQSISERLAALRERSRVEAPESPIFLRKISATALTQPLPEVVKPPKTSENVYSTRTPELHRANTAPVIVAPVEPPKPKVITEKFSPYCLEPKEYIPEKKIDLHRTSSQRSDKQPEPRELRELHRASSVRCSARRDRGCVGMEPMEINWSVRQLKTLFQVRECHPLNKQHFQDARAPSIDTDYNYPY